MASFIVQGAGFPAVVHDALPFEGQRSQRAMVSHAAGLEHAIVRRCPSRLLARVIGILVERLMQELWAGQAALHGARFAAALEHWGDAAELLHLLRGAKPLTIGAERCCQTGRHGGTSRNVRVDWS